MDAHRKSAIIRTLEGSAIGLVLVIAMLGLFLNLRIAQNLRDEQRHVRAIAADTRRLVQQHEDQNLASEQRLRAAIRRVEELFEDQFRRMRLELRTLRFEVQTVDGRTIVIERTIRPDRADAPTPTRPGRRKGNR